MARNICGEMNKNLRAIYEGVPPQPPPRAVALRRVAVGSRS